MKTPFFIAGLFLCTCMYAQNLSKLDMDNGLWDIRLGVSMDSVSGFAGIFSDPDIDDPKYEFAMVGSQYSYTGEEYKDFFGASVSKVFLATEGHDVSEIKVVCAYDSLLPATLVKRFGEPSAPLKAVRIEEKKAELSTAVWEAGRVRLVFVSKKYLRKKDAEEADVPDFMYAAFSRIERPDESPGR
jgi:hypothetical protein